MSKRKIKFVSVFCAIVMVATVFSTATTNVVAKEDKEKAVESLNPDVAINKDVHTVWQENNVDPIKPDYIEKAIQYISEKYNIPITSLTLDNEGYANYPLSDRQIWCCKISDHTTHSTFGVHIDESGNVVDINLIEEAERAAYYMRYGKLEIALYQQLLNMLPQEKLIVWIWLNSTEEISPRLKIGNATEPESKNKMLIA